MHILQSSFKCSSFCMPVDLVACDSPSCQVQHSDPPRFVLPHVLHQAISIPAGRNHGAKLLQRDYMYESSLQCFFLYHPAAGYGTGQVCLHRETPCARQQGRLTRYFKLVKGSATSRVQEVQSFLSLFLYDH